MSNKFNWLAVGLAVVLFVLTLYLFTLFAGFVFVGLVDILPLPPEFLVCPMVAIGGLLSGYISIYLSSRAVKRADARWVANALLGLLTAISVALVALGLSLLGWMSWRDLLPVLALYLGAATGLVVTAKVVSRGKETGSLEDTPRTFAKKWGVLLAAAAGASLLLVGTWAYISFPFLSDLKSERFFGDDNWGGSASSIIALDDGGYAVAASLNCSFGGDGLCEATVLRFDSDGKTMWEESVEDQTGQLHSIAALVDGGFVAVGVKTDYDESGEELWVLKFGSGGKLLWAKTYGRAGGNGYAGATSVAALTDGGFVVVGATSSGTSGGSDAWVLRFDRSAGLMWEKTYGGINHDGAGSVAVVADGGFAVAGRASDDTWIFRLDSNGEMLWEKIFDEPDGSRRATSIIALGKDGFAVAEYVRITEPKALGIDDDARILRLDSSGEVIWEKVFRGVSDDVAAEIAGLADGGFVVAGVRSTSHLERAAWVFKLDSKGKLLWEKTFSQAYRSKANSIAVLADGGFVVAGSRFPPGSDLMTSSSGAWIFRFDPPQ